MLAGIIKLAQVTVSGARALTKIAIGVNPLQGFDWNQWFMQDAQAKALYEDIKQQLTPPAAIDLHSGEGTSSGKK